MVLFLKELESENSEEEETTPAADDSQDARSILSFNMIMFLTYSALRMMGGSMISNFIVLYLQDVKHVDLAAASFIASGTTLLGFIAAPVGGFMAARFGEKKWIFASFSLGSLLLAASIFSRNVTIFAILYIGYGFCNTLGMAARSSTLALLSPRGHRGLGYALFFLPGSVMGAVAPVMAGFVAEAFGFTTIFYISLGIYVIALGILKFMVRID